VYGCPYGAKWTARDFVDEARGHGLQLVADAHVTRVLLEGGRAAGVEARVGGATRRWRAPLVVLAAGGIGSPRLLRASGLMQGPASFFSDPVVAVMGSIDAPDDIDDIGGIGGAEVPMAAGASWHAEGVALADLTLPRPMYAAFALQAGRVDRLAAHARTLSIMVKIRDTIGGRIGARWVDKTLSEQDRARLCDGSEIARAILKEAGARHLFSSHHFAAHPGGSARIGDVVDADLRTATPGLYVCDAAVIPAPWGLPPTLTLLCLGKRLGTHLAGAAPDVATAGGRPAATEDSLAQAGPRVLPCPDSRTASST
jgi:choline dehydrogenase-like flavoprotein